MKNQGKAVVTGFHSEATESEVTQLLKESINEVEWTSGMQELSAPQWRSHTHSFTSKNDEERNKFIRSAKMLKKELRGRKIKITRSMDAEERFHNKRILYVKYYIHMKHNVPLK